MSSKPDSTMHRARKPKLDWRKNWPLMLKLYEEGLTVPHIHQAIQSNGFAPSLRAVYNKFNDEGYPTCHGRQPKSQSAASVTFPGAYNIPEYQQPPPMAESVVSTYSISLPHRSHTQMVAANVPSMQPVGSPSIRVADVGIYGSPPLRCLQGNILGEGFTGHTYVSRGEHAAQVNFVGTTTGTYLSHGILSEDKKSGQIQRPKKRKVSEKTETEVLERKPQENGYLFYPTGGRTRHAHWTREDTRLYRTFRKIRSFAASSKSKINVPKTQARESALLTDKDSGYPSGHGSQSTFSAGDSLTSRTGLSTVYQELYRVLCSEHHERKHLEQCGDELPCLFCGLSSIHILAWSAPRLELQEFLAELTSKEFHDLQAIDAAGNSALHYAAASGAGIDYLEALINAGVPLYQRNTGGQNFLHCLRPCYIERHSLDCFDLGLIRLLDLVDPNEMFGQQDNNGKTVLHVIASYISDPKLKAQIFKKFNESGHPDILLDRFGRYATSQYEDWRMEQSIPEEIHEDDPEPSYDPFWWEQNINYPPETANNAIGSPLPNFEAFHISDSGEISCHPLTKPYDNPRSIDSKTKDTILHVLSRMNVQSKGSSGATEMIKRLQNLVARGVKLNCYNKQGQTPLTAFICNQKLRGDETGATLAKYADTLMWKGGKWNADIHGVRNDINIDMMNRRGATALHEACVGAHFAVVCSLIHAGANVNARLCNEPNGLSVLQATYHERAKMVPLDPVRHSNFGEIISVLEHNGAVRHPTMLEERGRFKSSS